MDTRGYASRSGIGLTRGMRLNNFIVGPSNASAFTAAREVVANPGRVHNPLTVSGEAGTGKTHLINAIGNAVLESLPELAVRYLAGGTFLRELAEAAEGHRVKEYLASLSTLDLLLVDDLHMLQDQTWALAQFLSVEDAAVRDGTQVVMTWCSRTPREVPVVSSLKELFRCSALVYLWPADGRTKARIIQKELEDTGLSVPARMVSLLALADTGDIRELKGIVRNIVARAHLCGEAVDRAMVETVLAKLAERGGGAARRR